jgi:hypothetical protein
MSNGKATTTVVSTTSVRGISSQLSTMERYVEQNKQWQRFVCAKLTAPVERVLRDLHAAAKYIVIHKGLRENQLHHIFKFIISRVPGWPDEECSKEFDDPSKDINACIRMAVRAQAIVMALTISRQCKEVIHVPNSEEFFKRVVVDTAREHSPEVFASHDCEVRKMLRLWITDNINKHLLSLVPISLFTEEEEEEEKGDALRNEIVDDVKLIIPPVCDDDDVCTVKEEKDEDMIAKIKINDQPDVCCDLETKEEIPKAERTSHALIKYENPKEVVIGKLTEATLPKKNLVTITDIVEGRDDDDLV